MRAAARAQQLTISLVISLDTEGWGHQRCLTALALTGCPLYLPHRRLIMHTDSEDAKAQLAMEAQIVAKEKEVLRELEEAAMAAAEEGQEAEEVEDSSALRNQFNFSDRTYQTVIHTRRDAEMMTVPPTSIEFCASAVRSPAAELLPPPQFSHCCI